MPQLDNRHSLNTLRLLEPYETFLESIRFVADMGCGTGDDTRWWATLCNKNDPPEPYNFIVYAVDTDGTKLDRVPELKNIFKFQEKFDKEALFPVPVDFIWAHDCLQYSTNPLHTLKKWNDYMNRDGMLVVTVPQHTSIEYGRQYSRGYNQCYFHWTPLMLIYMLAVNGFDCRDAYLLKKFQDPWIQMAVYKSGIAPMDPQTTTWHELAERNLLHPSIVDSLNANGFIKQEEIIMPWLDKELYFIDYVSQKIEVPQATAFSGVANGENEILDNSSIMQPVAAEKTTTIFKPMPLLTKPPTRKSYRKDNK